MAKSVILPFSKHNQAFGQAECLRMLRLRRRLHVAIIAAGFAGAVGLSMIFSPAGVDPEVVADAVGNRVDHAAMASCLDGTRSTDLAAAGSAVQVASAVSDPDLAGESWGASTSLCPTRRAASGD